MADFRSLTIQSGVLTQIQDANSLVVGSGIKTISGNLTITPAGTDVSVSANKNLSAAAGSGAFDFSSATGTFKTSTGANTLSGDTTVAANKGLSAAAGSGIFDFSASTGAFSTSTGAVTVGGAATFTAAGTALTVNNAAAFAGALYANGGIDRSTAATLSIGTTNATAITIGKVGVLTTIAGDLQVDGAETVVGQSTFTDAVTFKGPVTVGDGLSGPDTLSFDPTTGRLGSATNPDIKWLKGYDHVFSVDDTTTNASGGKLTIRSGAATTGNNLGGALEIKSGDGYGTGTAGSLILDSGAGGAGGGPVYFGTTNASAVNIGHSGVTTTVTGNTVVVGDFTQSTGVVSITGNGASSFTTTSGALTITSGAAATWSTSAGALSLDGYSGLNLQSAGVTRLAVSDTALTVQAGVTLGVTGSGNINLPNNVTSRFKIEGTAVGSTVTAANLDTLTNGSNADSLHVHASASATDTPKVIIPSLTTTGVGDGYAGYVSSGTAVSLAKADALSTARVFGFNEGTASKMTVGGVVNAYFEPGLTPLAGEVAYLSNAYAGMLTNVPPTASGSVVLKAGLILEHSGYAGSQRAYVLLQVGDAMLLA